MADVWDGVASPVVADPWAGVATPVSPAQPANPLSQQFDAATNAGANLIRPFVGLPQVNDSPDLDALKAKGWSNLPTAQKVGAVEEALLASPPGQMMQAAGGTVMNLPSIAMGKINQGLEAVGVPHQYSQAAEMALPLFAKGKAPLAEAAPESLPPVISKPEAAPVAPNVSPQALAQAHDILGQALDEENIKPQDIADRLEAAQPTGLPLTAMDLATKETGGVQTQGRNLLGLADAAANMPGRGAALAGDVAARGMLAKQRIGNSFDKYISGNKFYDVQKDAIQDQDSSGPLFQEAFKANQDVSSPEINAILDTPVGKQALKNAVTTMQNDRANVGVSNPDLVEQATLTGQYEPGEGGISSGLKLRTLHYIKQELWDMAQAARDSRTGEDTAASRAIKGQWASLVNELKNNDATKVNAPQPVQPGFLRLYNADDVAPGAMASFTTEPEGATSYIDIPSTKSSLQRLAQGDPQNKYFTDSQDIINGVQPVSQPGLYEQGLRRYSTAARQKDALAEGRKFMSMDPEEIGQYLNDKNRSNVEKSAFAAGVRRDLQDKMGNVGDNANAITALWKDKIRDRLEPLFPDKKSFEEFSKAMQHEQTMARNNGMLTRGSQTNLRGNYQEQLAAKPVPKAAAIAKTVIEPQGALANKVGDMLTEALQKRAKGMSQETAAAIMHYLMSNDPAVWRQLDRTLHPPAKPPLSEAAAGKLRANAPAAAAGATSAPAAGRPEQRSNAPPFAGLLIPDAEASELPPQSFPLVDRIARAESGGNPNAKNPKSSASGLLQFTNKTWADMVARYGKQAGVTLKDKADPQAQQVMGQLLARDNARFLAAKLGRPPTDGEIYAAHVFGPSGAAKLLSSRPDRQAVTLFPRSVTSANRGIFWDGTRPRTAAEVSQLLDSKVA